MSTPTAPEGWYPDPLGERDERFWDGEEWTERARDALPVEVATAAPVPPPVPRSAEPPRTAGPRTAVELAARPGAKPAPRHGRVPLLAAIGAVLVLAVGVAVFVIVQRGEDRCDAKPAPSAQLAGCNLAGKDLTAYDLSGSDLSGADLSNAKFDYVTLSSANLSGANLTGASLSGSDASAANLQQAVLDDAILDGAMLDGADLTNAAMHRVSAVSTNFTGAKMAGAQLVESNLTRATLSDATLAGATVQSTTLDAATMTRTDFADATLTGVSLVGANLEGVQNLTDAQLASAFGVAPLDVAKTLSDGGLYLESEDAIETAAAAVCTGTAAPGAGTSPSNGAFVVIVNSSTTSFTWPNHVPALRYLESVVCVGATATETVETCGPYFYSDGRPAHDITRDLDSITVNLVNPATAAVVATQKFSSPDPDPCPVSTYESVYSVGYPVDEAAVEAGITQMVANAGL